MVTNWRWQERNRDSPSWQDISSTVECTQSTLFTDPSLISHQLFAELPYIMKKIKMTYCEYICTLYLKLPANNISCLFSTSYSCADENIILKGCKIFTKYTFYYFMTTKVRKYKIRNIFQWNSSSISNGAIWMPVTLTSYGRKQEKHETWSENKFTIHTFWALYFHL